MKASLFVMCDRATVREGLLHILGAGVNRLGRPSLPAPMGVDLAALLIPDRFEELPGQHQVSIVVRDEAEVGIASVQFSLGFGSVDEQTDPFPNIPLSIPLQNVGVTEYGFYTVSIEYDGQLISELRFVVEKEIPPGATEMFS